MAGRKAANAAPVSYESLLSQTRQLIHEPKWRAIGYSCYLAKEFFNKTVVQFHKDLSLNGKDEGIKIGQLNRCFIAYRFYETLTAKGKLLTDKSSYIYAAAVDKQYAEGKCTADQALKRVLEQEGGMRRVAASLSAIVAAERILREHPEIILEMNPTYIANAAKALSRLVQALNKAVGRKSRRKVA